MIEMETGHRIKEIEKGCIECLTYFSIFHYPLKLNEIFEYNTVKANEIQVSEALENLLSDGRVFKQNEFYLLENKPEWVTERIAGNQRAFKLLERSKNFVKIIASFPFVRGVAISGSLSKFYTSENPDIDYFIITRENRLWIARTLLHLFKKLTFLVGHQHFYCMNFFIDTSAMALPNKNRYIAIELLSLIPVYNLNLISEFRENNRWTREFLPNHPGPVNSDYLVPMRKSAFKGISRTIIELLSPQRLNRFLMKLTDFKWRRKWKKYGFSREEYERRFFSSEHISKNHPADYERKVKLALEKTQGKKYQ